MDRFSALISDIGDLPVSYTHLDVYKRQAVNMAGLMNKRVLGLVENMSYFVCPDCGKQHSVFGESHIDETAKRFGIEHVAKLPIDPAYAAACDAGQIESLKVPELTELADYIERGAY